MKKIVAYRPTPFDVIVLGRGALVLPLNHPGEHVSNRTTVRTSIVTRILQNGVFETLNTRYIPQTEAVVHED